MVKRIQQEEGSEMLVCWILLLVSLLVSGPADGCVCPDATVLSRFPSQVPADVCCLNFSGSSFGRVSWSAFSNGSSLETLDLSNCNISSVDADNEEKSSLQKVFLGGNRLTELPGGFLSQHALLLEVDLSWNLLEELPEGFLQRSEGLQKLNLHGNRLSFLPASILHKPRLQQLDLDGNSWDCSCLLLGELEAGEEKNNRTNRLQDLLLNLTCSSPRHLAGRTVGSVRRSDACRPAGLTALFIILPLLFLSALLLCWCCGRKRKKKKEAPVFSVSKKRAPVSGCDGQKLKPPIPDGSRDKEAVVRNQLLLRPASTLLGSTRDIYEEVEVKLGSVESVDGGSRTELDTVSVTEVMKDSADREKAYMNQSTQYYSLVPGIQLDDSDHGEYENVQLS